MTHVPANAVPTTNGLSIIPPGLSLPTTFAPLVERIQTVAHLVETAIAET